MALFVTEVKKPVSSGGLSPISSIDNSIIASKTPEEIISIEKSTGFHINSDKNLTRVQDGTHFSIKSNGVTSSGAIVNSENSPIDVSMEKPEESTLGTIGRKSQEIFKSVTSGIQTGVEYVGKGVGFVRDGISTSIKTVTGVVSPVINTTKDYLNTVIGGVNTGLQGTVGVIGKAYSSASSTLSGVLGAIPYGDKIAGPLTEGIAKKVSEVTGSTTGYIPEGIISKDHNGNVTLDTRNVSHLLSNNAKLDSAISILSSSYALLSDMSSSTDILTQTTIDTKTQIDEKEKERNIVKYYSYYCIDADSEFGRLTPEQKVAFINASPQVIKDNPQVGNLLLKTSLSRNDIDTFLAVDNIVLNNNADRMKMAKTLVVNNPPGNTVIDNKITTWLTSLGTSRSAILSTTPTGISEQALSIHDVQRFSIKNEPGVKVTDVKEAMVFKCSTIAESKNATVGKVSKRDLTNGSTVVTEATKLLSKKNSSITDVFRILDVA